MSKSYSDRLLKLIKGLSSLPGIGPKSAERITLHLMKQGKGEVEDLVRAILEAKANTFFCEVCNNLSDQKLCHICSDPSRDQSIICVVEDPKDVASVEKTGGYHGIYHVLLGVLSPLEGIGPRELKLDQLVKRVKKGGVKEVVLATNPNAEGDATAFYLTEILKSCEVTLTRIARGVPVGSHLEYVDQATLHRAMEGRTAV
jgi:recombination protein RecR